MTRSHQQVSIHISWHIEYNKLSSSIVEGKHKQQIIMAEGRDLIECTGAMKLIGEGGISKFKKDKYTPPLPIHG
jgi:hypothetical protein